MKKTGPTAGMMPDCRSGPSTSSTKANTSIVLYYKCVLTSLGCHIGIGGRDLPIT
jgi:hypothetical protein